MKKKIRIWQKILISIVCLLILAGVVAGFAVNHLLSKMEKSPIDKEDLSINKTEIEENYQAEIKDITNIALLGVDADEGESGRSDSILIATIDESHKKLKLTSIMRDSYVDIPERGMDKINHAYAFGGEQLTIKTINSNFGLNIEDYVTVNFSSLPEIIDLLGGVEINITEEEVPHIAGIEAAGTYNLTGEQALSYSRIRYAEGGDYVRTERQRNVLEALFSKFLYMPATSYLSVATEILPYLRTSLDTTDILSLATKATPMLASAELEQERFPLDGYSEGIMIDDVYYLSFDLQQTKTFFMDYIFDDKKEWQ